MIEDIALRVLNRQLTGVCGTYHVYEGHLSGEPISIWLRFEGIPSCRFAGAPDGWRLLVDVEPPKEVDMQESGAIRLCDMSRTPSLASAMNQPVRKMWLILSANPEEVVGVRFDFDKTTVRVLNWGDEMYINSELPEDAKPGEISERQLG